MENFHPIIPNITRLTPPHLKINNHTDNSVYID